MLVLLVLGVATGADNQISGRENFRELFVGAERRRGFWQVSKGDWQGRWGKVGLHFPEPAQAWEDESRLSHQAVHELKMLTSSSLSVTRMGGVDGCCGAASGEREGDRERAEAPSGAPLRVSIECLESTDENDVPCV